MRLLLILIGCALALGARAQLEQKDFHLDQTDPAATDPKTKVLDLSRRPCAIIKLSIPLDSVQFDTQEVVKVDKREGAYWVYVSTDTERLDIYTTAEDQQKHKVQPMFTADLLSREYYEDGTLKQEKGVALGTYILVVNIKSQTPRSSFTLAAGFCPLSLMGPTLSAGFMFRNFTIEAGATYGLGKSKDVYIYDKGGSLVDAYNYTALRGHLRLGYDIWAAPVLAITPQVGAAITSLQGSRLGDVTLPDAKTLDGATAISATLGARFMFAPSGRSKPFRLFLTPEYDLAVQKDKNYEALADFDSKVKSWAEGLQLSLGLMFYF